MADEDALAIAKVWKEAKQRRVVASRTKSGSGLDGRNLSFMMMMIIIMNLSLMDLLMSLIPFGCNQTYVRVTVNLYVLRYLLFSFRFVKLHFRKSVYFALRSVTSSWAALNIILAWYYT